MKRAFFLFVNREPMKKIDSNVAIRPLTFSW